MKTQHTFQLSSVCFGGHGGRISVKKRSCHRVIQTVLGTVFCLFLVCGILVSTSSAQTDLGAESDEWLGITGLLVDETMTKGGRDLFEIFSSYWQAVEGMDYTIYIKERADVIRGSQFWIKVDDDVVYEFRLSPRQGQIEEYAQYSVSRVYSHLMRRFMVKKDLEELY